MILKFRSESKKSTPKGFTLLSLFSKNLKGFTLIEMMVTVAITAFLAAILLTYSHKNGQQIILSTEKAKIAQTISRIKSMALTGFTKPPSMPPPCAYGFYIDYPNKTYSIFNYYPSTYNCEDISSNINDIEDPAAYPSDFKFISTEKLSPEVKFTTPLPTLPEVEHLGFIVFTPPEPSVLVFKDDRVMYKDNMAVYLTTQDGSLSTAININYLTGQLSF